MKYQKLFYVVCGTIFAITLSLLFVLGLVLCNTINLSIGTLCLVLIGLIVSAAMSFICGCVLQMLYNDKKARTVKTNARWKR